LVEPAPPLGLRGHPICCPSTLSSGATWRALCMLNHCLMTTWRIACVGLLRQLSARCYRVFDRKVSFRRVQCNAWCAHWTFVSAIKTELLLLIV
jgi:hypothetical protein